LRTDEIQRPDRPDSETFRREQFGGACDLQHADHERIVVLPRQQDLVARARAIERDGEAGDDHFILECDYHLPSVERAHPPSTEGADNFCIRDHVVLIPCRVVVV
jgi:hypothetical protein